MKSQREGSHAQRSDWLPVTGLRLNPLQESKSAAFYMNMLSAWLEAYLVIEDHPCGVTHLEHKDNDKTSICLAAKWESCSKDDFCLMQDKITAQFFLTIPNLSLL